MATRRAQSGPAQSYATVITGASVIGAVAATWFGYPGAVVVWAALAVAGWLEQAPPFTGKKDQRGFPTPAHPGEQKAMNTYRFWADLRWRLLCPTLDWLPGWPVLGSWLAAVAAAALVSFVPVDGTMPGEGGGPLPSWAVYANMAAAFVVVTQVMASRRRTVAEDDQCPGARVNALRLLVVEKKNAIALAAAVVAVVAVVVYVAMAVVPQRLTVTGPLGQLTPLAFPIVAALAAAGAVVAHPWQAAALAQWRELVQVRREWAPRWQALKQDPAPFLTEHKKVGPATVDTFDAPPSVGAAFFYTQSGKITPTLGANMRVAVLEVPNTDGQGQPVPGTAHPLRFDVVMWPADQVPDIAEPGTDPAVAELMIRCSMAWAADMIGFARFILTGCDLVTTPESPCVWATQWAPTMEIGLAWVRTNANGALANGARTTVLTDHRMLGGAGVVFYGALCQPGTEYDPSSGITEDAIAWIAEEDEWRVRWAATLKQNVNAPVPQQAVKAEATLADGTVIHHQPFVTLSGEDPAQFMTGLEGKLAATIPGAAPFMSIAWFTMRGTDRVGERHAQAFTVSYSDRPVPSMSALAPTRGDAPRWVISGHMNDAFTAARLARPEVLSVQCLTSPGSREHIWQVSLRLYGGVTLSDVRGAAQRIKTALGTKWLRVAPGDEGCVIFAGGEPGKVKLARPERDTSRLVALDWGQAWLDSKVSGVGGLVPTLTGVDHLPKNETVQVLDFDLPSGLSVADVKGATEKLKTATGNAFVEVRPGAGGASTVRLLVCEVNPLPDKAPYDFEEIDRSPGIPFATGIDGECIAYNPRVDPHLLVAGASGGGKSVTLQAILYGAIVRGWDVYVADPTKGAADFRFAEPYARAVTVDAFEAAAMMKAVYAEVVRRKNLNSQHGVGNYRDLPEDIRPRHMLVMIDEFTSLMGADPVPRPSEDPTMDHERDLILASNQAKTEIGVYAGKCAREARSAGLTLVLATQKLSAKLLDTIPGAGDLKVNLSRMLLGKATNGDRMSALRAPFEAPELGDSVPPGRGLWETTEGAAKVMQGWYDPREQALLSEQLAERLSPLTVDAKLDLTPFMAKVPQGGDDGFGPIPGPVTTEPVVVELDELEVSLDDLLSFEDDTVEETAGELPEWAAEFAAAQHDVAVDPFTHGADPVWAEEGDAAAAVADLAVVEPAETVVDEEVAVFLDVEGVLCPAPAEWGDVAALGAGVHGDVTVSPTMLRLLGRLPGHLVWATAWGADADATFGPLLGRTGVVVDDTVGAELGWWKLDAVMAWLDAHPAVKTVVWVDGELAAVDDLDVEHRETAWDLLADAGVDCLLLAPAAGGLSPEDMVEVHGFLDVVPDQEDADLVEQDAQVGAVADESPADDPSPDTVSLPAVGEHWTVGADDVDQGAVPPPTEADPAEPPAPPTRTSLLAPVPDEW